MKVTLHGAAGGEVTGSAYLVETSQAKVLVDFGMFQGVPKAELRNRIPRGLLATKLNAVLVTHAHLDHCGRLPLLAKGGFEGRVYCTPATVEMCDLILRDSAKVQAQDAERVNRKRQRAGRQFLEPLYNVDDVDAIMRRFRPVAYGGAVEVAPGIVARFVEAGHMLGSASILITASEDGRSTSAVFSGDLGPKGAPILKDAEPFRQADHVFLESTYGGHNHKPLKETVDEFLTILKNATATKGKVLVPTFAVGRAQLLMVLLAWAFRQNLLPKFPIFLDSPMAIEATKIYSKHPELFDEELTQALRDRPLAQDLDTVTATITAEESKTLNFVGGPCLILAGAGMCNAGRILHHLRQNLWRPETHVLFVGYQAPGSLGRQLIDGKKLVSIFGEKVAVRASIHTLGGFSAHAGQRDLMDWIGAVADCRPRVFLTHGETRSRTALANLIRDTHQLVPAMPGLGESIELLPRAS